MAPVCDAPPGASHPARGGERGAAPCQIQPKSARNPLGGSVQSHAAPLMPPVLLLVPGFGSRHCFPRAGRWGLGGC